MRKLMIERIREIIGNGPRYDSYVVDKIKVAVAGILKQDVNTKAGKSYLRNLDLSKFDFDKMILQDEDLLYLFEITIAKFYQQH